MKKMFRSKKSFFKQKKQVFTVATLLIVTLSVFSLQIANSKPLPPPNWPPEILYKHAIPNPAAVGEEVEFRGKAKDLENGTIYWTWDFGDGDSVSGSGWGYPITVTRYHAYSSTGTFRAWFNVSDMGGKTDKEYIDVTITNDAPNTPDIPSGPTALVVNEVGVYSTSATDPDDHQVEYRFDWGDGDISTWTGLSTSGYVADFPNYWDDAGVYEVKTQTRDEYGLMSSWSDPLYVTVVYELDIDQSGQDRGFPIRHAMDGDWGAAQSFQPTLDNIAFVEVYMRTFGTPEFDLTVELREDDPEGNLLDTIVLTPAEVGSSWNWVEVDFNNVVVDPAKDYFIVMPSAPSGVTTSFGYEWGYAFGNQYDDGAFWFTRDGGGLWRDLPTMYEFTFKTYGYDN